MTSADVPRLSASTVDRVRGARLPDYERSSARPGIVHLGLGAFARGHLARYCDDLLAMGEPAAITGVSLRSGSSTGLLADQDGLYTLIETDGTSAQLRVIGAVTALAHGGRAAVDAIAHPTTTAVTLTITEKGYHRVAGDGIDSDDPAVAHDLALPNEPVTAPGVVVAALRRRRDEGLGGLAVVSCDNLPTNGAAMAGAVGHLATALDPELAAWITDQVHFPSSVVDRIVPASTADDRQLVADRLGRRDHAPVRSEQHCSWVIEHVPGLPAWERTGALLVQDVGPWEQRKLRTVNGPHSALAYLGGLAGHVTIDVAANDPDLARFVEDLLIEEVMPTLHAFDAPVGRLANGDRMTGGGEGANATAPDTLGRFRNPALRHRCAQVAADGSQKLPQRIVDVVASRRAQDLPVDRSAAVIAAWIGWILWCHRGKARLDDPLAPELLTLAAAAGPGPAAVADAFLAIESVFAPAVADDPVVRAAVARGLALIHEHGAVGAAHVLAAAR